jgi:RNA polymerase sigma-70 factor, ECF subfamily
MNREAFFARFSGDRRAWEQAPLSELIEPALAQARAAFPDLDIAEDVFLEHLGARVDPSIADPEAAIGSLHVADLYLACGCTLGLPGAQSAFSTRFLAEVPRYLARIDGPATLADEVRQELAQRLLLGEPPEPPRIATYNGQGALASWVAISAQRLALNLLARKTEVPIGSATTDATLRLLAEGGDPELLLSKQHLRQEFEAAIRTAIAALSSRDRMLLRLSVTGGMSCRKLAEIYKVNFATVSRWQAKLRGSLLANVEQYLRQERGIDPADLTSMLGLARSQIDLSLSGLLGAASGGGRRYASR